VAKYVPTILVFAVLVGSAAAFAVAERLKLEPSPILGTRVTKSFSPVCKCASSRARIAFRLGNPDVVSVSIIDAEGRDVRVLADSRAVGKKPIAFLWNGRDDSGQLVADGVYRPRVRLAAPEKTFVLSNLIRVDTSPPRVTVVSVTPRTISPDGDRRGDRVTVRYRLSQPARAMLLVDGVRRVLARSATVAGELQWFGQADGRSLSTGTHRLTVVAVDPSGNRSASEAAGSVRIRYLELGKAVYRVHLGRPFLVSVSTDARRVSWLLAGRRGVARPPVFRLRSPAAVGSYTLYVSANQHGTRARVVVVP
jgi:hypothetical protein